MRFRTSLRYRVTLAFAVLGLVVSLGLAGALYVLTIDMEEHFIAEMPSAALEDYIARYRVNPKASPPTSATIRTYAIPLGIGVLVMTLSSALLGFWLAGRVIAPVGELAMRLADLRPEDHRVPLALDFPCDEVGMLARNFDGYLRTLATFIEREQAFTADVSHELRTPLAVIKGASEVLLDDPGLSEAQRLRVERITRSTRAMSELVKALLLLAREEESDVLESGCVVGEVLQRIVEDHRYLLHHKPVEIKLDIQAQAFLPVECTLLRVVLANLIRNALYYTEQGHVSISLDENGVSVKDTGIGIPKEQIHRIFDRFHVGAAGSGGIGLSLVKRICQRCGWYIDIDSQEGRGTLIRLSFLPSQ